MHAQEFHHVDGHAGFHEGVGDPGQISPFVDGGAAGRAGSDQRLELPPQFQHQHLFVRIDVGNPDAMAANDGDQPLPCQPLQGFTDRRPADRDAVAQHGFRPKTSRRQFQRDDQLFELAMGDVGQPVRAQFGAARRRRRCQIRHPRRHDGRGRLWPSRDCWRCASMSPCQNSQRSRAMTSRWISLVPSTRVRTLASPSRPDTSYSSNTP